MAKDGCVDGANSRCSTVVFGPSTGLGRLIEMASVQA